MASMEKVTRQTKRGRGTVEVYRVRWRYSGKFVQIFEHYHADAKRAVEWISDRGNNISPTDPLIVGRAYLVGEAKVRETLADARTFSWAAEQYLASRTLAPTTLTNYRSRINRAVAWADRPVASIGVDDLNAMWAELVKAGLIRTSRANTMAVLRAVLSWANGRDYTTFDPRSPQTRERMTFRPTASNVSRRDAISPTTFTAFLDHVDPSDRAAVQTMANIGARIGELLALRVGDVDLHSPMPTITINGSMVGAVRQNTTKDHREGEATKPVRPLPITAELVEVLRPLVAGRAADEPLFAARDGRGVRRRLARHWHTGTWRNAIWAPAVVRAREAGLRLPEEFTPHCLRHSMATWLAPHLSPAELQQRMRHASIKMTLRYYHDSDAARAREVAALESVFAATAPLRLVA